MASREDHERFLFYDGPLELPAPVSVCWANAERDALLVRAGEPTDFVDYLREFEDCWSDGRSRPLPKSEHLPSVAAVRKAQGRPVRARFITRPP